MNVRFWAAISLAGLVLASPFGLAADSPSPSVAPSVTQAVTPVSVGHVLRHTFVLQVSGPGKTTALESHKIVAPFAGTLVMFHASAGDDVRANEVVAKMISETSVAQIEGAREMLKSAHTSRERRDAKRALALARKSVVTKTIRTSEAGVVVSVNADEGVVVAKDQELVSLAPSAAIGFLAEIDQTHLEKIHTGLVAFVKLAGAGKAIPGRVHAVLPAGSPSDLQSPVRIDFLHSKPPTLGVFGTADIVVGRHQDVLAVPEGSVLRNDVMGTTKIAFVTGDEKAHWTDVKTGISEQGLVEVLSPQLRIGESVIVSGQVGLPEGTQVRIQK
jgi:multidrug efflux pump subunit AcrA (membrane-fusion protein)